jgi:hypothetical protein
MDEKLEPREQSIMEKLIEKFTYQNKLSKELINEIEKFTYNLGGYPDDEKCGEDIVFEDSIVGKLSENIDMFEFHNRRLEIIRDDLSKIVG